MRKARDRIGNVRREQAPEEKPSGLAFRGCGRDTVTFSLESPT